MPEKDGPTRVTKQCLIYEGSQVRELMGAIVVSEYPELLGKDLVVETLVTKDKISITWYEKPK